MGLDLSSNVDSIRLGSYGSVHVFRGLVALCSLLHTSVIEERYLCAKLLGANTCNADIAALITKDPLTFCINILLEDNLHNLDYGVFANPVYKKFPLFKSLALFINHSDCDGKHTAVQVKAIFKVFEAIRPQLFILANCQDLYSAKNSNVEELQAWFVEVFEFFKSAADADSPIVYC